MDPSLRWGDGGVWLISCSNCSPRKSRRGCRPRRAADLARLFASRCCVEAGLSGRGDRDLCHAAPARADRPRTCRRRPRRVSEEIKGPRAGAPPQALEGFLRKTGLTQDQLGRARRRLVRDASSSPGRATADVLAEAIPAIVRAFPWPKSMRWGEASVSTESPRWVRPLQGIVALLGERDRRVRDRRRSNRAPRRSATASTIPARSRSAAPTIMPRSCAPATSSSIRRSARRSSARAPRSSQRKADGADPGRGAGRRECRPHRMAGAADGRLRPRLPRAAAASSSSSPCGSTRNISPARTRTGKLSNRFVCVANIDFQRSAPRSSPATRRCSPPASSDAKFFWEQDLKVPLAEQAEKLDQIVFHEKLGTVADKVERVAKLAAVAGRGAAGQGRRSRRGR